MMLLLSFNTYAFKCKTGDDIGIRGGTQKIENIPLHNDIFETPNRYNVFANIDEFIYCWNERPDLFVDYLYLTDIEPGPNLIGKNIKTGVILRGNVYMSPMSGNEVNVFTLDSKVSENLDIQLFVKVDAIPSTGIIVKKGDKLISMKLHKYATWRSTHERHDDEDFTWEFYAGRDIILGTGTCDINDNHDIIVDFGTVNISGVSTIGSESSFQKQVTLNYSCEDLSMNQNIKMVLDGTTTSFSNNALLVNSSAGAMPGLGVEVYRNGKRISPLSGSFLSNITNGIGSDLLTFSLVKKVNLVESDLKEGDFNSSATIIMTTP
ncbi:TPA: fimbrial protein [Morganella morganii]|nr:fimbrial protein [Morganella morganii]